MTRVTVNCHLRDEDRKPSATLLDDNCAMVEFGEFMNGVTLFAEPPVLLAHLQAAAAAVDAIVAADEPEAETELDLAS